MGAFAAQAGLLDAAERCRRVGNQAFVDAHHAGFQRFGHAPHAVDVLAVEIGGQTERRVVGDADAFLLVLEADHRRQRAEGFLVAELHVRRSVGDQSGLNEVAAALMGAAAEHHLGALGFGVLDMLKHFLGGAGVDQRRLGDALFEAVADFQFFHRRLEFLHERIVHAVLHQETVHAHTGLAGVAELAGDGAFHGLVQIGVVEHQEGRVAAQFQGHLLDVLGAVGHQLAAHLGGAGEAHFAHHRRAGDGVGDGRRGAGDDIDDTGGDAGALGQLGQREGGIGGGAGGLDHHGAARRQGGAGLAGDHRRREVPRRDRGGHTDGLLDHDDVLAGLGAGDGVAVGAAGFLGEPLDKGRGVGDFALGFRQRLALFQGHQRAQVVLVLHHQVVPGVQQVGPLAGGLGAPGRQRVVGGGDRLQGVRFLHARHGADDVTVGGIVHVDGGAVLGVAPLAVDKALLAEKGRILEVELGHRELS